MALWLQIIIGWFILSIIVALVLGRLIKRGAERAEKELEEPDYITEQERKRTYNDK